MRTQDFFEIGGSKKTSSQMASKWPSVAILVQMRPGAFLKVPKEHLNWTSTWLGFAFGKPGFDPLRPGFAFEKPGFEDLSGTG